MPMHHREAGLTGNTEREMIPAPRVFTVRTLSPPFSLPIPHPAAVPHPDAISDPVPLLHFRCAPPLPRARRRPLHRKVP